MYTIFQVKQAKLNDLWLENPLISLVKKGRKRVYIGANTYDVNAGQIAILPANISFHNENIPDENGVYETHVIYVEKEIFAKINNDAELNIMENTPIIVTNDDELKNLRAAFYDVYRNENDGDNIPENILCHRKQELIMWFAKYNYFMPVNIPVNIAQNFKTEIMKIINDDISIDWNLDLIANKMGIGVANLRKKLASENTGFQKILHETRMMNALELIQTTDKTITEIAFCVGYNSTSRFSESFKKRFGIAPKALSLYGKNII